MDEIRVHGVPPWDGAYPLDWDTGITTREWRWLKQHAGVKPGTFRQAMEEGDADLLIVFAAMALHRAGRISPDDISGFIGRFDDVDPGAVLSFHAGQQEADADSPPLTSSSSNGGTSGAVSQTSSENPGNDPSRTGIPGSATSLSAPPMSRT